MKEKLNITKDEALDIISDDSEDYNLILDQMTSKTRWYIIHSVVIQRKSDGKYFAGDYSVGATEDQDQGPWDDDDPPQFIEVDKKEKVVIVYE